MQWRIFKNSFEDLRAVGRRYRRSGVLLDSVLGCCLDKEKISWGFSREG